MQPAEFVDFFLDLAESILEAQINSVTVSLTYPHPAVAHTERALLVFSSALCTSLAYTVFIISYFVIVGLCSQNTCTAHSEYASLRVVNPL